jgi:streptogramin lyase
VGTAEDECIVHYTRVRSTGTRHLSIDASNNIWVSGYTNNVWDLVRGGRYNTQSSGTVIREEPSQEAGGYGGLTDKNGVIWSARPLLRWDPNRATDQNSDPPNPLTYDHDSYGLCIDRQGYVWNTAHFVDEIRKFHPNGTLDAVYNHGGSRAQGCVVDVSYIVKFVT